MLMHTIDVEEHDEISTVLQKSILKLRPTGLKATAVIIYPNLFSLSYMKREL